VSDQEEVIVGETADGKPVSLPVVQLLTGRGFVTGKSGSGKSNSASVVAEELLEAGYPLLIVDTDGEYYGLKEEYEMLHAGADEECDIQIGPEHAEQMATLALEENVPIILDVSGYLDEAAADELLRETARQLFVKEKKLKKPFLLVVEEVHEYIPEGGGVGETGKLLIKISKRGRKHGLGILGISQRPADVKKDFITQANWLVWHRLTWENDTKVVGRILGNAYANEVSDLADGQAFVQTDWTEVDVRTVQFRRKRTFDAGATPGLDDFERPELKSVSETLVGDLQEISERSKREENRIEELQSKLADREAKISQLEDELASARDVSEAARQMADALSSNTVQTELPGSSEELRRLHEELVAVEGKREALEEKIEALESTVEAREEKLAEKSSKLQAAEVEIATLETENERLHQRVRELEYRRDQLRAAKAAAGEGEENETAEESDDTPEETPIIEGEDDREFGYTDPEEPPLAATEILVAGDESRIEKLLKEPPIDDRLSAASDDSRCTIATTRAVVTMLVSEGAMSTATIAERVDRSPVAVQSLLSELRSRAVVDRLDDGRYDIDMDVVATLADSSRPQKESP